MAKNKIEFLILEACEKSNLKSIPSKIKLDIPKISSQGDWSSNIALLIAKDNNKKPIEIANIIVEKLKKSDCFEKIEIAGPGFINFFLTNSFYNELLQSILDKNQNIKINKIENYQKLMIEVVSANPTGYLHIGHARNSVISLILSKLYETKGYSVTKCYYINDAGAQMNNLVNSVYIKYAIEQCNNHLTLDEETMKDYYKGEEISECAKKLFEKYNESLLDIDFANKNRLSATIHQQILDFSYGFFLREIKKDLLSIGLFIDDLNWISEKSLEKNSKLILQKLSKNKFTYENDNALILKTTIFGDDKDRVLKKSNGEYTYLVNDITLHDWKFSQNFDKYINIFGADHHGYIPRLKASIEMLGYNSAKLEICEMQLVRLIKDDSEYKMSKRKGTSVYFRDLVSEVNADVTKCMIISQPLTSKIDFNMNIAFSKGNENPYYYFCYAYVRCLKLLKKINSFSFTNEYLIELQKEKEIILEMSNFNQVLDKCIKDNDPHYLFHYLSNFSKMFHSYYSDTKIIDENNLIKTNKKLNFIYIIKKLLDEIFIILCLNKQIEM
ncbi:hypothetical protein ASO20_01425 [Mycoplasma sp. (ex Biomphalaria glabrata)]|uniref:arginine--tRNA ligase n=1 Tax=Mycoplasma sp. (ex Biomphalaria glabrata) TaxID=1749074 RepID=UPI00073AABB0|nr:arginine--tRNA ligase [Mycoplasma sp. (ex Biomphalaria glabrata)]ALV23311.1 hypothetical protein ASO20_01425 [Mycoplasma sp. (ex Biomphalaria glabrata)]